MSKEKKCLYTSMLNKLSALDEQIYQMQANLAKVREMVDAKFYPDESEEIRSTEKDRPPNDNKGDK
jgi:hypothetical protein